MAGAVTEAADVAVEALAVTTEATARAEVGLAASGAVDAVDAAGVDTADLASADAGTGLAPATAVVL